MTLLQQRDLKKAQARESLRASVRADLHRHLKEVVGGHRVWVFGSLCHKGRFNRASDIDIALESLPAEWSIDTLTGELMDRLHRPVDIIVLPQSRLAKKFAMRVKYGRYRTQHAGV